MAEDSLWRELDTQNTEDVLVRMRQGVYGKVNEDGVRRWLVERSHDPDTHGKGRVLEDRIKWIIQIMPSS